MLTLVLVATLHLRALAFSLTNPQTSVSRSAFFRDVTSAIIISMPLVAHADVTAKVASSAALRKVRTCQMKLATLEASVTDQDFLAIREALRVAPFSDLRKSMSTLVKGGEDGPNAQELAEKYKLFISSLETMDARAGLGARGGKVSGEEMVKYFENTKTSLQEFLLLAEASAEIPIQDT
jgi:hypothetical protein